MDKISFLPDQLKSRLKFWYNLHSLSLILKRKKVFLMNLGYQDDSIKIPEKILQKFNWPHSNEMLKLYLKAISNINKYQSFKTALEIGSGLGGGTYIVKTILSINDIIGLDQSIINTVFSRINFPDLKFVNSNFEKNNPTKNGFDLIFSVEASQHFKSYPKFLKNVYTSLNDNGVFLLVDLFETEKIDTLKRELDRLNFKIILEENLTYGVVKSIEKIEKTARNRFTQFLEKRFLNSSELEPYNGSKLHEKLKNRNLCYVKYLIKKSS